MVWLEVVLAIAGGVVLGGLLIAGRSIAPGATTVVVWLVAAVAAVGAAWLVATEPILVVAVGLVSAFSVIVLGAPWAAARADPHLAELPYWSRLRGDARLRADERRRDALPAHEVAPHRDLSTTEA